MKKHYTLILLLFWIYNSYSQELVDVKEFISEKIDSNDPLRSYDNYSFFTDDILKIHVEGLVGKSITKDEYENIFLYGFEAHYGADKSGGIWLTQAQIIDLRGIRKISTSRISDKNRFYYKVIIYLKKGFLNMKYQETPSSGSKIEINERLEILLFDNEHISLKLKRAFLKLGVLLEIEILDGDLF